MFRFNHEHFLSVPGLGKCLPVLIYEMPHAWCSLFDLFELLMPSLDERLDLPAHGKSLMLLKGKG